jgi:hypothetical protein
MDEGLIQFLVIAAIIIFSIMDGAAKKRRKEAQRLAHLATPEQPSESADDLGRVSDSSEGMVPEDLWKEIAALARGEMPASRQQQPATRGSSSTGDLDSRMEAWAAPEEDVSTKTRSADLQAGYLHPDQALTHKEHAQVASPAQPLPEEPPHEFVPHIPDPPSKAQPELRRTQKLRAQKPGGLLSGVRLGARRSLRDAIIVAEVLSPPVTLRDPGWKPLF